MHSVFARIRIWLLLPTIAFFVLIAWTGMNNYPAEIELESGFLSPIVAFELGTEKEIQRLLGNSSTGYGQTIRSAFDKINKLDYGFLIFYTLTFIAVIATAAPTRRMFFAGLVLCVLAMTADIFENRYLLRLTSTDPQSQAFTNAAGALAAATRIKWGLLFTISLLASFLILVKISVAKSFWLVAYRVLVSLNFATLAILGFLAIAFTPLRFLCDFAGLLLGFGFLFGSLDKPVMRTG